jgi:carbamoyl-phosphate synthase large subunit
VILQKVVRGEEMNVIGVGDGTGGDLGLVAIKKLWTTSLGKIWTGVTIKNQALLDAAKRFVREYKWKGAFELECIVDSNRLYLIEINPRFPAWVYFSTGVGVNLPSRLVRAALGMDVERGSDYEAGRLYVRYTYEVVTDMSAFQSIVMRGETG